MQHSEVGERIRYIRELNHYTRDRLAKKIQISSKFLYEIEVGKKGFSVDTLSKIATEFSVSCDFLIFGESSNRMNMENIIGMLSQFNEHQMGYIYDIVQSIYNLGEK